MRLIRPALPAVALAAGVVAAAGTGRAEEGVAAAAPGLLLQLNAAQPSDKGCRLTFVVSNNLGADLSKAAFEIALFNRAGVVDRLTVLDFKALPAGKTKVTRFDLPGTQCDVSRVLINDATECAGNGVDPKRCLADLKAESKAAGIEFGL